jgi:hypothetical protein
MIDPNFLNKNGNILQNIKKQACVFAQKQIAQVTKILSFIEQ